MQHLFGRGRLLEVMSYILYHGRMILALCGAYHLAVPFAHELLAQAKL